MRALYRGVGAVFRFARENDFRYKDEQQADPGCCCNLANEKQEVSELEPFDQYQAGVV
jgi:hypothetical protein